MNWYGYKDIKKISKSQNGYDYSRANKNFWYSFYLNFFTNILTNYFEWDGLPDSIDEMFLEKALCLHGLVGMFEHEKYGLIVCKGALGNRLDIYDHPTEFRPVSPQSNILGVHTIGINWYTDMLDPCKAIIISNNNFNEPSTTWLDGFCSTLADIEQTIQLNRNAQKTPYVVMANKDTQLSLKNLVNKVMNNDAVVYIHDQKTPAGGLDTMTLDQRIKVLDLKADFLLDKLHDEKQRIINQVLTLIGINNNAVDKAERLVSAEATSNNGLINACIQVSLNARLESIKRINKCWGLNITVKPATQIAEFNTEQIYNKLGNEMYDEYGLPEDDEDV